MRIIELSEMEIKRGYLPLLLDADPAEEMVMRYLARGRMFLLEDEDPLRDDASPGIEALGEIVVVDLGDGKCEIKNLAVALHRRGEGYGRMLIEHAAAVFTESCVEMLVGTSKQGIPFYEGCGFSFCHIAPGFFTDNYPEPIMENGHRCVDMYYLHRTLQPYPVLSIYYLKRQNQNENTG